MSSSMRYRRSMLVALGMSCIFLGSFLFMYPVPDQSEEQTILNKITLLDVQLQHSNHLNDQRKFELKELASSFGELLNLVKKHQDQYENNNSSLNKKLEEYESRGYLSSNLSGRYDLSLPNVATFLPHTLFSARALQPAFKISKDRGHVSVVIGIPTVRREYQSYLIPTLQSVFDNMEKDDMDDTLVIIFIAETDPDNVYQITSEIQGQFTQHLTSGLLEVISPPSEFYPDMTNLRQTLGDDMNRVAWRSKQALDFSFLMMYAKEKGTFYVQLEDDVLTKKNFVHIMKKYALEKMAENKTWFLIDFCQLGFIGKLFRSADLPWLVQFFIMFYNDQPVDWMLEYFLRSKICKLDQDVKKCRREVSTVWLHYKPSLFQHIGTHSSLKGKVQKLKDRQFGRVQLFTPHKNPRAVIESPIKHYKHYSLERLYRGDTFFWGLVPQAGDKVLFKFQPPVVLESFKIVTGNVEHPSDRLVNTSCEVQLQDPSPLARKASGLSAKLTPSGLSAKPTRDGFYVVGTFNHLGVCEGTLGSQVGAIQAFRLNILSSTDNWAILSEIFFKTS